MDIRKVKRTKINKKEIHISVRVTKEERAWLKKNDLSPTKIFREALKELKDTINYD